MIGGKRRKAKDRKHKKTNTIYEPNINAFIKSYRSNWKRATAATRKAAKEYWIDIYKNAIFPESFRNAERMLAVISELESEV